MKTLIMGWFSFELYGATAGDLMACQVVQNWLNKAGSEFDTALAPPFEGGINWREVNPSDYTHLLFVCGPFGDNEVTDEFLNRFNHCIKIGINLSMLDDLQNWNPFDILLERDSSECANPDISLMHRQKKVPVVGLLLVHPQTEYKGRGRHKEANNAIHRLIQRNVMAVVDIDTRLDENRTGLRTATEVESLIARMDLVLTTRLHGMVLAVKNSVPAVVIDAIHGGAKVTRQAEAIGWPAMLAVDSASDDALQMAYEYCLSEEAKHKAFECARHGQQTLFELKDQFLKNIKMPLKTVDQ